MEAFDGVQTDAWEVTTEYESDTLTATQVAPVNSIMLGC